MWLTEALRIKGPTCIAFVGAGGKTTALFQAARELISRPEYSPHKTVIVTTTTHLGSWQSSLADRCHIVTSTHDLATLELDLPAVVVLLAGEEKNGFLGGLSPVLLEKVWKLAAEREISVLIEADGSHHHPLKAPLEHEPAIPDFAQMVVVVAGLRGMGKPLNSDWVHRVERFAQLSGLVPGEQVSQDGLVRELLDPLGGLKNIPERARRIVLLNQADTRQLRSRGRIISERLIPAYDACIVASMGERILNSDLSRRLEQPEIRHVVEGIGGIILAAGESRRLGEPKQLLTWKGQSFVRHVVISALKANLKPVIVVVGAYGEEVEKEIADLPARIVRNPNWKTGLSSSIKAGISALPENSGGAIFLQADQPQVPVPLLKHLVEAHSTTLKPIIAPMIDGRRGNPVLFDRDTFQYFSDLEGDTGGRALFNQFPVQSINWNDPRVLVDIDTAEDYQRFLKLYQRGEKQV
jgi:molybdenum cofactor cytidylyltransferase